MKCASAVNGQIDYVVDVIVICLLYREGRTIYYLSFFHRLSLACDFDAICVSNRPVIHCPVNKNRVSILTAAA